MFVIHPKALSTFDSGLVLLLGKARLTSSWRRDGSAVDLPFQRKREKRKWRTPFRDSVLLAGLMGLTFFCGCSNEFDSDRGLGQGSASITELIPKAIADAQIPQESDDELPAGKLVAKLELPSPGRTNAFELSGEFQTESATQETGGKREIYVIGFVEVDTPRVMLSIDGRTETLKANDSIDRITVLEIAPPRAKLSLDGVSWNASIFDKRNANGDGSVRRKNN